MKKAGIITIGNEILIGQTVDTNSAWIGAALQEIGFDLVEILSIGDELAAIHGAIRRMDAMDWILITGGLGPTHDDITKEALAAFFDDELIFNEELYQRIVEIFKGFGRTPTEAHRRQCYLPTKAVLLENKKGTAPGMLFEWAHRKVVSMPGVPYEMKYIMKHAVLPMMDADSEEIIINRTVRCFGLGESYIAERIEDLVSHLAEGMSIAFLPSVGHVRVRTTARAIGADVEGLRKRSDELVKQIEERLGHYVYGHDDDLIQVIVGNLLREKGLLLATAESCTGGNIAAKIVSVPGASEYFVGSVVSYSNGVKMKTLGVEAETLKDFGAVSEPVVRQMVRGACHALNADISLAVSGIAGPGGGSKEKPVGTFWIACGTPGHVVAKQINITKDRAFNIQYITDAALNMLRLFLMGVE